MMQEVGSLEWPEKKSRSFKKWPKKFSSSVTKNINICKAGHIFRWNDIDWKNIEWKQQMIQALFTVQSFFSNPAYFKLLIEIYDNFFHILQKHQDCNQTWRFLFKS